MSQAGGRAHPINGRERDCPVLIVRAVPSLDRSGYVTGRVHSVADADRQNVNARLVGKLDERGRREAARIKQAEPPPCE